MVMLNSFAPIDVIIFAVVACVVLFRLYRQLGTRVEMDEPDNPVSDIFKEAKPAKAPVKPLFSPDEATDDKNASEFHRFAELQTMDPTFDEKEFLEGASIAYDMIITALANGDAKTLKPLLNADMYDDFCAEIKRRRTEGHTYETELVGIDRMAISAVRLENSLATLVVEIESEQSFAVYDGERNLIEGSADELMDIVEVWHFQRNMRSANPNWILVHIEEDDEEEATD